MQLAKHTQVMLIVISSLVFVALVALVVTFTLPRVAKQEATPKQTAAVTSSETLAYIKDNLPTQLNTYKLYEPTANSIVTAKIDDMQYPVSVVAESSLLFMPSEQNTTINRTLLLDQSKNLFNTLGYTSQEVSDDITHYINGSVLCMLRIQDTPPQVVEYSCTQKNILVSTYKTIDGLMKQAQAKNVLVGKSIQGATLTTLESKGVTGGRVDVIASDEANQSQQSMQLFYVKMPNADWNYVASVENKSTDMNTGKGAPVVADNIIQQLNKPEWNGVLVQLTKGDN